MLVRSVDPRSRRTIGILTELDPIDIGTHALSAGAHVLGVVNYLQQDIVADKRIYEVLRSEAECFRNHPQYQNIAHQQKLSTQSAGTRQGRDDGDGDDNDDGGGRGRAGRGYDDGGSVVVASRSRSTRMCPYHHPYAIRLTSAHAAFSSHSIAHPNRLYLGAPHVMSSVHIHTRRVARYNDTFTTLFPVMVCLNRPAIVTDFLLTRTRLSVF
jgi:hypothetical protein